MANITLRIQDNEQQSASKTDRASKTAPANREQTAVQPDSKHRKPDNGEIFDKHGA